MFGKKYTIAVHDGKFHADDIFACATVSLLHKGKVKIVRTRDQAKIDKADYVVDVGCVYNPSQKRFDHHMPGGAGTRANGIMYAAFGLVWKEYGARISGNEEIANRVDGRLVSHIDADDNGISLYDLKGETAPYTLQSFLYTYRPTWKEDPARYDEAFLELVEIAKGIISREVKISNDALLAKHIVLDAYNNAEDKRIVIIDTACPFQETLFPYDEVLYVVHPRFGSPNWNVSCMHKASHGFLNRKSFPVEWAGLRDEELATVSGVPDAVFCHNGRFLAVAKSKEGAIKLAKLAVEN